MVDFNEDPRFFIERFSKEVQEKFIEGFKIKYGFSGFIPANKAYNEYIRDPYHTHLNSTKWASLTEFVLDLEQQGIVETTKEVDASGTEQILLKLIDKDQAKKEALAALQSKEFKREAERKREEKELEKTIKMANKREQEFQKQKKLHPMFTADGIQKKEVGVIQFETGVIGVGKEEEKKEEKIERIGVKGLFKSGDDDDKLDLALLQKNKQTNLDKLLQHNAPIQVIQQKRQQLKQPQTTQWVRPHLIVKVKKEGSSYQKIKGEVLKILSPDKIIVKMQSDNKEKDFSEKDLAKVLPSEGGRGRNIDLYRFEEKSSDCKDR